MDIQTITITFSKVFQQLHYTGKEKENSCTNFFNFVIVLQPAGTTRNSAKQRKLTNFEASNMKWQSLKHSTINESALQHTVTSGTKQNKTYPAVSVMLSDYF